MVPTSLRIRRADFPAVIKAGRRQHGQFVTAVCILGTTPQVSVVVSKKVAKRAVDRNRLRRRVYGAVERFLQTSPLAATVIFLVKPEAKTATRLDFAADVADLLAKIAKSR